MLHVGNPIFLPTFLPTLTVPSIDQFLFKYLFTTFIFPLDKFSLINVEETQGKGVVLAETKKAASSVLSAFRQLKANILVQEFIKEANGKDIRALVIGNEVVGAMERTAPEGDFRANLHLGGDGREVILSDDEKDIAIKAAKTLGLGIAGVDLIKSKRGLLVIEVNSSPGLEGIEAATSSDIASKMINYIESKINRKL